MTFLGITLCNNSCNTGKPTAHKSFMEIAKKVPSMSPKNKHSQINHKLSLLCVNLILSVNGKYAQIGAWKSSAVQLNLLSENKM